MMARADRKAQSGPALLCGVERVEDFGHAFLRMPLPVSASCRGAFSLASSVAKVSILLPKTASDSGIHRIYRQIENDLLQMNLVGAHGVVCWAAGLRTM